MSEGISKSTQLYCQQTGKEECVKPLSPNCEDRTILCLDELPVYDDMVQTNLTGNDSLHEFSLGAKFSYKCKNDGKNMVNTYPMVYMEYIFK